MEKEEIRRKKVGRLLLAVASAASVLVLVILWNASSPFLIDNDNIYLKTIVSGEMTGKPEPHMYYMGILSGLFLSLLYSLTGNGIPWFGIFLCVCLGIPLMILLYQSLEKCKSIWSGMAVWATYVFTYCAFFYHYFAKTQFTMATGLVGTAALFVLALLKPKESLKDYLMQAIPFLVLTVWSMGMRDKGFFMLLPFLGMVFLGKMIGESSKKVIRNVFVLGCVFVAVMAAVYFGNRIAYGSAQWREFQEYTDASEVLFDYDGFPDYESHKELYEGMGITESSMEAITHHYNILMDGAVNRENMVALAEVAEAQRKAAQPGLAKKSVEVLGAIARRNVLDYVDRPVNLLVYLLYLIVAVLAVLEKKWMVFKDLGFLAIARMFDWFYLVWYGRYPFRVTQIIYMAELVVLIAIILSHDLWEKKKVFFASLAVIVLTGIRFGLPVMKGTYGSIKGFREMSVCFTELEDYLAKQKDHFYYFDMSHLYYMEDTLAFRPSAYENYVYMGSWMPNSPWYVDKMKAYGIEPDGVAEALFTNPKVYLLYQQVDFDTRDFLDDYFADHLPGTKLVVVDTFTSSNGFLYEVLKLQSE